jgi:K+-sensing histidine kinase KdpD
VRREGTQAVLRVSDRGPGVPPAERERIFEPFYRLPGASEREGGVGLGLALVKSIASATAAPCGAKTPKAAARNSRSACPATRCKRR